MHIVETKQIVDGEEVTIYIEVDNLPTTEDPYGDTRGAKDQVVNAARDMLGDAMQLTHSCAQRVVKSVKAMDKAIRPEEFEVKLAIKLDSELGAFVAKASSGAQIEVAMKWKPRDEL